MGVALIDIATGLYAVGAIASALLHRQRMNVGQHIQCNLLSTQVSSCVQCTKPVRPASIMQFVYRTKLHFNKTVVQS